MKSFAIIFTIFLLLNLGCKQKQKNENIEDDGDLNFDRVCYLNKVLNDKYDYIIIDSILIHGLNSKLFYYNINTSTNFLLIEDQRDFLREIIMCSTFDWQFTDYNQNIFDPFQRNFDFMGLESFFNHSISIGAKKDININILDTIFNWYYHAKFNNPICIKDLTFKIISQESFNKSIKDYVDNKREYIKIMFNNNDSINFKTDKNRKIQIDYLKNKYNDENVLLYYNDGFFYLLELITCTGNLSLPSNEQPCLSKNNIFKINLFVF